MRLLYVNKAQFGGTPTKNSNEFAAVEQSGAREFDLSKILSTAQSMQDGGGIGNGPFGSQYGDSGAFGNYATEAGNTFLKTTMSTGNPLIGAGAAGLSFFKNLLFHKKNREAREERNKAEYAATREAFNQSQIGIAQGTAQMQANKTNAFLKQAGELQGDEKVMIANNGLAVPHRIRRKVRLAKNGGTVTKSKNNTIICSTRKNLCKLVHKSKSPFHEPIFKRGGHVVNKYKKNVILDGPSHDDINNTGHNDDKGLPIVKDGGKMFEVESDELILNTDVSKQLEKMAYEYLDSKDSKILIEMGRLFKNEIQGNTYSYSDKYKELNHD